MKNEPSFSTTARIERSFLGITYSVHVVWSHPTIKIDRPVVGGWGVSDRHTAERLKACVDAGKAYVDPMLVADINCQTYVEARSLLWGRCLDRDLKALGF